MRLLLVPVAQPAPTAAADSGRDKPLAHLTILKALARLVAAARFPAQAGGGGMLPTLNPLAPAA